jgi:nucleotide-binding universal stress UspA family protein
VTNETTQRPIKIVVGVDGSPSSNAALEWGAQQAELTSAELEVVTAWQWPMIYGDPFALPPDYDPGAHARETLEDSVSTARAAHPKVEFRGIVVEGRPAPVLVGASHGADLLVVGSRGHGEFAGMLLGSVSEHCTSNAYCPVLVLRSSRDRSQGGEVMSEETMSGNRIVVGVDGSKCSLAALEWAGRQAELTGLPLQLVTAWHWPTAYGAPIVVPTDFSPVVSAEMVLEAAAKVVREAHPDVEISTDVNEGHPASVLVKASEGAALLVVGSRGHGEFVGMLLGSVSEHCVAHAHCPVLILRREK